MNRFSLSLRHNIRSIHQNHCPRFYSIKKPSPLITSTSSTQETRLIKKKVGFKQLVQEYGKVAVACYFSISTASLMAWFTAVKLGVDVQPIIDFVTSYMPSSETAQAGTEEVQKSGKYAKLTTEFLVAYAAHKLFLPLRLALVGMATPKVAAKILKERKEKRQ